MQPDPNDDSPDASSQHQAEAPPSHSQHGYPEHSRTAAGSSPHENPDESARASVESDAGSWTLSPSTDYSHSGVDESRLSPIEPISPGSESSKSDKTASAKTSTSYYAGPYFKVTKRTRKYTDDRSPLQEFPEEILLHVLSHLHPSDMLTVKLVSRRFRDLVNSPHAWIDAFSRYFPGPGSLKASADTTDANDDDVIRRSDRPLFTRLKPRASWAGEYLARMQLLRCLTRGKPSVPWASPSPGKPGKASATFTYSSRMTDGISHLHANFGHKLHRRLPQFVHGASNVGDVSSSDKRGKYDAWGTTPANMHWFRRFDRTFPASAMWGLGPGSEIGIPNVMDVSASYGMIYGEGAPGGQVFFLSIDEKRGRYLESFSGNGDPRRGIPSILPASQSTCSVWLAKNAGVPQMTNGMIGIMAGSSCGVVTAYSLGSNGRRDFKLDRGDISARWMVSPGVPIISISVDDEYSHERHQNQRVWAVVLNALGELYYLNDVPQVPPSIAARHSDEVGTQALPNLPDDFGEDGLSRKEIQAWATGKTVNWHSVEMSQREPQPDPYSSNDGLQSAQSGSAKSSSDFDEIPFWIRKKPSEIRSEYKGWDMRRRLEVDFAGDDGKGSGESIFVIDCGLNENQTPSIKRYTRCNISDTSTTTRNEDNVSSEPVKSSSAAASVFGDPTWSFPEDTPTISLGHPVKTRTKPEDQEWRCSKFSFGRYRSIMVTTTALDLSKYALTTASEDTDADANSSFNLRMAENGITNRQEYSPFGIPGQRARFIGAGTGSGSIFLWNARAHVSASANLVNTIKPVRIIHTDSPQITSMAISALYVVHGGSEGLVQAWDPLASTMQPIRTLTSRSSLNIRRRQVIAAQQNPNGQNQYANSLAAGAICIDPDPTVLRGIVAVGIYLRYYSFSSTAATGDLSKSQKRRIRRSDRGLSSPAGETGVRRVGLKTMVAEEVVQRQIEEKERKAVEQEDRRVAARFGLDLFGAETSEEQLLAYAQMVSEEDYAKTNSQDVTAELPEDASEEQIQAHEVAMEEYNEKWKFASWGERFEMSGSGSTTRAPTSVSATPARGHVASDDDFARALELSLQAGRSPQESSTKANASPIPEAEHDEDLARAIKASLEESTRSASPVTPGPANRVSEDDEALAKALSLSLAETTSPLPSPPSSDMARSRQSSFANVTEEEFPALGSTPPGGGSASRRARGKGKGRV